MILYTHLPVALLSLLRFLLFPSSEVSNIILSSNPPHSLLTASQLARGTETGQVQLLPHRSVGVGDKRVLAFFLLLLVNFLYLLALLQRFAFRTGELWLICLTLLLFLLFFLFLRLLRLLGRLVFIVGLVLLLSASFPVCSYTAVSGNWPISMDLLTHHLSTDTAVPSSFRTRCLLDHHLQNNPYASHKLITYLKLYERIRDLV